MDGQPYIEQELSMYVQQQMSFSWMFWEQLFTGFAAEKFLKIARKE